MEKAISYLQKKSSTTGDSVFSHLVRLIQFILDTKAKDAVDLLETSILVKQLRFLEGGTRPPKAKRDGSEEKLVQNFLELFGIVTKAPDAEMEEGQEEGEATESGNDCEVEDFLNQSSFYEMVGVGLGQSETYLIGLAMRQLASKSGVTKVRFFGKFFGTSRNYYVFETTSSEDEEPQVDLEAPNGIKASFGRPIESIPPEKGEGTNSNVYWVCNYLGEKFHRLPNVTPLQIQTSRLIQKFLTGNLKAEVSAYPPFPGVEENYLRAQIARISANTILAPKGYFKLPEEDEEEEGTGKPILNEEWVMPSFSDLEKIEEWVHVNPHLKKQGRCSLYIPEKEEPEEGEEEEEEVKQDDGENPEEDEEQSPELLSSIDNDAEISEGMKPWSVSFSSGIKSLKHQIVCLRSLLWPGAYAIATKDGASNVYIGWGIKKAPFEPILPPIAQREYEEELAETQELPPIPEPEPLREPNEEGTVNDEEEEEEEEDE